VKRREVEVSIPKNSTIGEMTVSKFLVHCSLSPLNDRQVN
jgi:hypothetical protein